MRPLNIPSLAFLRFYAENMGISKDGNNSPYPLNPARFFRYFLIRALYFAFFCCVELYVIFLSGLFKRNRSPLKTMLAIEGLISNMSSLFFFSVSQCKDYLPYL